MPRAGLPFAVTTIAAIGFAILWLVSFISAIPFGLISLAAPFLDLSVESTPYGRYRLTYVLLAGDLVSAWRSASYGAAVALLA